MSANWCIYWRAFLGKACLRACAPVFLKRRNVGQTGRHIITAYRNGFARGVADEYFTTMRSDICLVRLSWRAARRVRLPHASGDTEDDQASVSRARGAGWLNARCMPCRALAERLPRARRLRYFQTMNDAGVVSTVAEDYIEQIYVVVAII